MHLLLKIRILRSLLPELPLVYMLYNLKNQPRYPKSLGAEGAGNRASARRLVVHGFAAAKQQRSRQP
jgi:hypothetical protein